MKSSDCTNLNLFFFIFRLNYGSSSLITRFFSRNASIDQPAKIISKAAGLIRLTYLYDYESGGTNIATATSELEVSVGGNNRKITLATEKATASHHADKFSTSHSSHSSNILTPLLSSAIDSARSAVTETFLNFTSVGNGFTNNSSSFFLNHSNGFLGDIRSFDSQLDDQSTFTNDNNLSELSVYGLHRNATIVVDSGIIPEIPNYIRYTSMVFCILIMCLGVIGNVMVSLDILFPCLIWIEFIIYFVLFQGANCHFKDKGYEELYKYIFNEFKHS